MQTLNGRLNDDNMMLPSNENHLMTWWLNNYHVNFWTKYFLSCWWVINADSNAWTNESINELIDAYVRIESINDLVMHTLAVNVWFSNWFSNAYINGRVHDLVNADIKGRN